MLAGGVTLRGPAQTLPALYALPSTDFHDITSGSNGVFNAGPGYDEVTGIGTPQANLLFNGLVSYGTANHFAVVSKPPSSVIAGDGFGVIVAAENSQGAVDPAFSGTMTIALAANPGGGKLGGTLTVTAYQGLAVFDGLTLNNPATGYTLKITGTKFPAVTTSTFNITTNPTPWQGTFYPVPTDASLRTAITKAEGNTYAFNTIELSASDYLLSNSTQGGLLIENTSSLSNKIMTIVGAGETSTIIGAAATWQNRILQITGSSGHALSVTLENLTIERGIAHDGGLLGGQNALGGGLLISGAAVTLSNVTMQDNQAQGPAGAAGAGGKPGLAGKAGGNAEGASGGAIYLASGSLTLLNDTITENTARGGQGGEGGAGGGQGTKSAPGVTGGPGGAGGTGGAAAGGGIYAAGGTIVLSDDSFSSNQAVGGVGGTGGTGGSGGHGGGGLPGKPGGVGGAGGTAGNATGGAIYVAGGSLTLTGSSLQSNQAVGGQGGQGGAGGPGTAVIGSITGILGGSGSTLGGLSGLGGLGQGGPGGNGGPGGPGGRGSGGGVFVAAGSVTLLNGTLTGNQAIGGQGGAGGRGGTGGFGGTLSGLPLGQPAGQGGIGGNAIAGFGGGINVAGGTVVLSAVTLSNNVVQGGKGGSGGPGGYGALAALGSSLGGTGLGTTGIGGSTGLGGGTGANSAGAGGNGGNGASGVGGGLYVSNGTLTLTNATVADNSAEAGASGSGGIGGKAGTGNLTGGLGASGGPGASYGGGFYVKGGTVRLDNSTIALNSQQGNGTGGGGVQAGGTVTAVSTLIGGNGPVDYSGNINATDSLFQKAPVGGVLSGTGNLVGANPLLVANGLQNNGGPTQTIALQTTSPAIGKGTNPNGLLSDQRGFAPRTGSGGTDIGALQHNAQADKTAPAATLKAVTVTSSNAGSLNPYTFTIDYSDNVAVASASLVGSTVEVIPPGSQAPVAAIFVSAVGSGKKDSFGDAQTFTVTYKITPPGGAWTTADNGTYSIVVGGSPVTDLAGNAASAGTLGTFLVQITAQPQAGGTILVPPSSTSVPTSTVTTSIVTAGPQLSGTGNVVVGPTTSVVSLTPSVGTAHHHNSKSMILRVVKHSVRPSHILVLRTDHRLREARPKGSLARSREHRL